MGLSQLGSWPIQMSFATSAVTVQPTEQCVQMLLWTVTCAPGRGGGPASALRTEPSSSAPTVARLPAARPERRRNERRSRPPSNLVGDAPARFLLRARRSVLLVSTAASSLRRIAIDAVI